MKAYRIEASDAALLDVDFAGWSKAEKNLVDMTPTPLALVKEVSPFLAASEGHGAVKRLEASALHNGSVLALRLSWESGRHDRVGDLDSFVDGVGVLYPLAAGAAAVTMGAKGKPTNAWYWKAGAKEPFDVLAEGFAMAQRRPGSASRLSAAARHDGGKWSVVFRRPLAAGKGFVGFVPGVNAKIAFAAWDGANAERSGRKSFSGEFVDFHIQK